ncbi:MAG: peptidoglycan editing factor PgeF [Campylobacteraceae bacterium]|nr:peptidoglycan editing factor PgeF [Campylobacteraceae bacterium]
MDASLLVHFTNRHGGVSEGVYKSNNLAFHVKDNPLNVTKNRTHMCKTLGIEENNLIYMNQVHGTNIKIVDKPSKKAILECDGVFTKTVELALMVQVADCTPVLIYAPDEGAIGAFHAGRAGAFEGIIPKALGILKETFKVDLKTLHVWLGPSIGQCCYEISGNVLDSAKSSFGKHIYRNHLDISAILCEQLQENGVTQIYRDNRCSACDTNYFSYRRDGSCGRQAGIIMLRKNYGQNPL